MKVLKTGRPQKGWAREYFCSGVGNGECGCSAQLLVEQDDVFQTQLTSYDDTTIYYTFRCPECGTWTDLLKSDIKFGPRKHSPDLDGVRSGEEVFAPLL